MTLPIMFVMFLALFFLSWQAADIAGSKTAYLAMIISGVCAVIDVLMMGGIL